MTWDPTLYSQFAAPRLRPAMDLVNQIPMSAPKVIVDLGCGTGNVTRILQQRWPEARIYGVDSSPDMLAMARAIPTTIQWVEDDISQWQPDEPVDVLFSNAALHWLDDHETLFPHLLDMVAAGGFFAVQMPHNHYAASHTVLAETVEAGHWAPRLRPLIRRFPVADMDEYYRILSPYCAHLDCWETEYLHVLSGENPVVEWTKGSALRPLLAALTAQEQAMFLEEYGRRIALAYYPQDNGKTLFPFLRLFLLAQKQNRA